MTPETRRRVRLTVFAAALFGLGLSFGLPAVFYLARGGDTGLAIILAGAMVASCGIGWWRARLEQHRRGR